MFYHPQDRSLGVTCFVVIMLVLSSVSRGREPEPDQKPGPKKTATQSARKNLKLPGLMIDFEKRCVDLEGTICIDRGFLELVACTKGTKEHESIVAIKARPMHVHAALLALGTTNGNPAMRKRVDGEKTRWVSLPPRGDRIHVYLAFKNSSGKMVERPVSDFITRSKGQRAEIDVLNDRREKGEASKGNKFPNTFLFAGSRLRDNGKGPRQYLADLSGHVISIATFGDELLCLPGIQSHANGALTWQVDSTHLPKVGTKITLRLRPKKDQTSGVKN